MRARSLAVLAAFALSFVSPARAADRYAFDTSHTYLLFFIDHLGFSETVGQFRKYGGGFTFDEKAPETSTVDVTLYPASISTASSELDAKLQTDAFFNSAKFPEIRFVSTRVEKTGVSTGKVTGNLTMLGVTKPVTLDVMFNKAGVHPYSKANVAGFRATGRLKRSDFGMAAYLPMIGDEVTFRFEVEGVRQDAPAEKPPVKPE